MDDLIRDFLVEAQESLDQVDLELVAFEARPDDRAALDKIFRLVHTLKGTAGFLNLPRLEALAHAGETLLSRFRDGTASVTPASVTLVLRALDTIKEVVSGLESSGEEPSGDDHALIAELESALEAQSPAAEAPPPPAQALERPLRPGEVSLDELEAAFQAAPGPSYDPVPAPPEVPAERSEAPLDTASTQSIRVGVEVLEGLMTLVSELVLTRNQLLQLNRRRGDDVFGPPLQRLSAITGQLQDNVMKTRLQPIGAAWKKLPRLVRDLSQDLGKSIELTLEGEGTELDRQVLEQIRDPLTHMVRNAADHGLERPEERLAAGKSAAGRIRLSALQESGSIVIRLEDDGRGLDTERIRETAIQRGLVTRTEGEVLSDAQVHKLIFAAGFSTASAVTAVSGRGVGMDVVRSNIEAIGGQIDLQSAPGLGCTMTIKIPLTLAIISSLIVGVGNERLALPQASVLELIKVGGVSGHRIETIDQVSMVRLRERLIPLVDLAEELGLDGGGGGFVVVLQVGKHRFGVRVGEVIDTEEIVVKPLSSVVRGMPQFSGATILGDGSVILILDPNALSERAGTLPASVEAQEAAAWESSAADDVRTLLIVHAGRGAPKAVDLSRVTRLEHVPASDVQRLGDRASLYYRGRLLPVLTVDESQALKDSGVQPILVFTGDTYALALAVDRIVDVVETRLSLELAPNRPGILGVAAVAGQATDVLDVNHFMLQALAEHIRGDDGHDEAAKAAA